MAKRQLKLSLQVPVWLKVPYKQKPFVLSEHRYEQLYNVPKKVNLSINESRKALNTK